MANVIHFDREDNLAPFTGNENMKQELVIVIHRKITFFLWHFVKLVVTFCRLIIESSFLKW